MMIIVRVLPLDSKDDLWFRLSERLPKLQLHRASALFISQHQEYEQVNIVFHASSFEAMVPIICNQLPACAAIRRTRTSPLLKPVFFPVPKERPEGLHRYRLALKVQTSHLGAVFDRLASFPYPDDVFPTYQAISLGDDDILASILSPERQSVEFVVREQIANLEGVLETDVAFVYRNLRLASGTDWRRYRQSHYLTPAPETADEEFDWLNAAMTGAFVDEL